MNSAVRYGLALFGHRPEDHVPLAVAAERLGFRDLWLGEHIAAPSKQREGLYHEADIIREDTALYDIWTVCGAVLGATTQMTVSPGVLIAGLRHPVHTAQSAITAARVGGGRFRLGIGAGWLEEEFELVDVDFKSRFARMEEIVDIVRRFATGGAHGYDGRFYSFTPFVANYEATNLPIVFGGLTEPAIARAARLGDGWYGVPGLDATRLVEIRDLVKSERGGLDNFEFHVRLGPTFDPEEAPTLVDLGFDRIVVPWECLWSSEERLTLPIDGKIDRLRAVAARLGLAA
jgi:alkanesulfonate monooxygenase SsuD/methylene tetrahydromethanopterin reductase-like flavin-dependent oxidoreductase (luciferase family)